MKKKRYSRLSVGCVVLAITTGKKRYSRLSVRYSCLSVGCAVLAITTGKKKRYSRLSVGCAVLGITTGRKKDTVKKKIHYDRKKKDTVVCLMGARFWRLRPEKKRYSRLGKFSLRPGKKKIHYDQKKKKIQSSLAGN